MIDVLVVEDEQILRRGLIRQVEWGKCGCRVCGEACNGSQGKERILALRPQIVITDVRMPVMDGMEMLRQTKATCGYEAIILSGFSEFEYARSAMVLGVADYLLKPVDLHQLEELVTRLAENIARRDMQKTAVSITRQAAEYIERHVAENLTATQISQALNVSPDHLNRLMKRDWAMTLHEYLTQVRIQTACQLLRNSPSMKVYEVAQRVGYPDYKYFHTVFTKHMGISPSEYKHQFSG